MNALNKIFLAVVVIVIVLGVGAFFLLKNGPSGPVGGEPGSLKGTISAFSASSKTITLETVQGQKQVALQDSTKYFNARNQQFSLGDTFDPLIPGYEITATGKLYDYGVLADEVKVDYAPNIVIYQPKQGESVGLNFEVVGVARVFENQLNWEIRRQNETRITSGLAMANSPDAGQYGEFRFTVNLQTGWVSPGNRFVVEAFDYSAKDGTKENPFSVEVVYDPAKNTETTSVKVFFNNNNLDPQISCNKVFPVTRTIPKTQSVARAAIEELLKGPTANEQNQGYSTSMPPASAGVKINSLRIENGTAYIDFNEKIDEAIGGSCRVSAISAQIRETLRQFPSVQNVVISRNGDSETVLQP